MEVKNAAIAPDLEQPEEACTFRRGSETDAKVLLSLLAASGEGSEILIPVPERSGKGG